ncbi:hypothetical protein [Neorhizobium galegae]|uniref:hypothetical protein n=1 Tax=Neorhizobium galegae TaxID=399 RepID=UPI0021034A29|nr:hypothetical protein [Neorhizobium galegae]MCQ1850392.1 hypothetical protein [Neorhizobium galegae]
MSGIAKSWLKRQTIGDRTLMAILSALAHEADQEGLCEITQAELARSAGLAARTVERSMPVLEALNLFTRSRQHPSQRRGRAADLITLSLDRDFTLTKEQIMGVKRMGPNRQNGGMKGWDQTDKMAGGPKSENEPRLYKERARGVIVDASPSESSCSVSVSTHVRFDRGRSKWRASLTVNDVTMELGRFDTEAEAAQFADAAVADVHRTQAAKAGTPRNPVIKPELAALDAPNLGTFLFGDSHEHTNETERSAQWEQQRNPEPDRESAGEGSALGRGTKFLVGLGEAHDLAEYDAARARGSIQ